MDADTVRAVCQIIVEECGCRPDLIEDIVRSVLDHRQGEYRFMGTLGFGGKLYWSWSPVGTRSRFRVNAYQEDYTLERQQAIAHANTRLHTLDAKKEV